MKKLVLSVLSLLLASSVFAQESVEVTIYNQNFALVREGDKQDRVQGRCRPDRADIGPFRLGHLFVLMQYFRAELRV